METLLGLHVEFGSQSEIAYVRLYLCLWLQRRLHVFGSTAVATHRILELQMGDSENYKQSIAEFLQLSNFSTMICGMNFFFFFCFVFVYSSSSCCKW